jgi:putative two-component system response regulator
MSNKSKIILVTNDTNNMNILERLLFSFGHVIGFSNGIDLMNYLKTEKAPDIFLIEPNLVGFNGYDVLEKLRTIPDCVEIPVILLIKSDGLKEDTIFHLASAQDYILIPFKTNVVQARIGSYLELKHTRDLLKNQKHWIETEVTKRMYDLQLTFDLSIDIVTQLVETRDPNNAQHISRTRSYFEIIMRSLQKSEKYSSLIDERYIVRTVKASPLHDIGKMGIPENILMKSGKLSEDEFEIIKSHTTIGYNSIKNAIDTSFISDLSKTSDLIDSAEFFKEALNIAKYHHEYWDGSGYPEGLKHEEIPLSARVMAVVDVFDALSNKRVYKEAWSIEKTAQYIISKSATQFDPEIVNAFTSEIRSIRKIWEESRK